MIPTDMLPNFEKCIAYDHELLSSVKRTQICQADIQQIRTSHLLKFRFVIQFTDTVIRMRVFNVVSNAPYCDCFNPEEEWTICSRSSKSNPSANDECIIRHSLCINFHGKSMMSGIIQSKAFGAQKENFKKWVEWAREKLEYPPNDIPRVVMTEDSDCEEARATELEILRASFSE